MKPLVLAVSVPVMVTASMLSVFGIVLVRRIRRQIVQTIDAADSRLGQIGAILDRIESRG